MAPSQTLRHFIVVFLKEVALALFLILFFVNDMPYVLKNAVVAIYADDTTLYVSAKNIGQVNMLLQQS